jgi:anti-sigma factor RsiW
VQHDHLSAEEVAVYVDGALSQAERLRIEAHLVQCQACFAELIDLLREVRGWEHRRPD